MSEQGWKDFLAADRLDDWVVLHGGATAVFPVESMAVAADVGRAVANIPAFADSAGALAISENQLTVRLTRDIWGLEPEHIDLARAVSEVVRAHGLVGDRAQAQEVQFAVAAHREEINVDFWRAVLGYVEFADDHGADPLGHGSTVWMQELAAAKALRHAMHVDVSVAHGQVEGRVRAALAAGGRVIDESEAPATWILADAAGNRVCVTSWPDGTEPAVALSSPDT
jgi:4a-hydroxytetrahydrobiopterin dehydratase